MPTRTYEIRQATRSDLRGIAGVHLQSWKTAYNGVVPAAMLDFDPTDAATVENSVQGWAKTLQSFPENLTVAVGVEETILGFCCAGPVDDVAKNLPYQFQIYGLHVRPQDHGCGIGSSLFHQALNRAASLGKTGVIVWTLRDLKQSRQFYERRGGTLTKSGVWELGGHQLDEVAYGWGAHAA